MNNANKNEDEKNNSESDKKVGNKNNKNNKTIDDLIDEYDIEGILGEGNFGKVKLGVHKITKEKVRKKYII
jgi:hypothetical protein